MQQPALWKNFLLTYCVVKKVNKQHHYKKEMKKMATENYRRTLEHTWILKKLA